MEFPLTENCDAVRVVIGAGALGSVLACDLSGTHRPEGEAPSDTATPTLSQTLLVVRTLPLGPVRVELQGGTTSIPADRYVDAAQLKIRKFEFTAPELEVYVCTHPDDAAQAALQFFTDCSFDPAAKINLVFCVNGLLTPNPLEPLKLANALLWQNINSYRALFFAGFMREKNADNSIVIRHNGGVLVKFGPWPVPAKPTTSSTFMPKAQMLKWEFSPRIDHEEYTKFFINLTIAMTVGPAHQTNSTVLSKLTAQEAFQLLQGFAGLRPDLKLDLSACLDSLWKTARSTGSNVNSISLAGSHGNPALFKSFWGMLWNLVEQSKDSSTALFWTTQQTRMKQLWGNL